MSEEIKDQLREANYDGIQEYDNQLPKWWLFTFVITVIFAFIYWSRYYVFESAPNQAKELSKEMQNIEKLQDKKSTDSDAVNLLAFAKDPKILEQGSSVYKANCIACHGQHGEGGIGPNLTDRYWIHGGEPENIDHTITNGVIEKGMASWKGILSRNQILHVSAYVMSLEGTNPANAKDPQGEAKK